MFFVTLANPDMEIDSVPVRKSRTQENASQRQHTGLQLCLAEKKCEPCRERCLVIRHLVRVPRLEQRYGTILGKRFRGFKMVSDGVFLTK